MIADWLLGRRGEVVVQGSSSVQHDLSGHSVGLTFVELIFRYAPLAIRRCGFQDIIYADDLNAIRSFFSNTSNEFFLSQLERCQIQVHLWGAANSVTFDNEKKVSMLFPNRTVRQCIQVPRCAV